MDQHQQQEGMAGGGTTVYFGSSFTPLQHEARTHVDTACAAYHLGRKPQTMRS
jgi:hypothetical protein